MVADYDLCVIGGGINGAGIARDAAGRGMSVLLVEARDLASSTSSASTKLVHGGLRYLEQFEFRLVREALIEREVLLRNAPHVIWPLEFILPYDSALRPVWMIRLGLFMYDKLGGRKKLPGSRYLKLNDGVYAVPLRDFYREGFSYSDCWADDARLVVLNAIDAQERGADILTHTAALHTEPAENGKIWTIQLRNMLSGDEFQVTARMVVNAGGPWVRGILEASGLADKKSNVPNIRLVKGSHIVVPRMFDGEHCYILQQPDERVVFAIPYEGKYTLIGTTDREYEGDPAQVSIDRQEVEYLCGAINRTFEKQISERDVVWSYSGVRPLIDDGEESASEVTRDYKLHMDTQFGPPVLSVFGGKITTYRKLSEQVVDNLVRYWRSQPRGWTAKATLPGGDIPAQDFAVFVEGQAQAFPFLPPDLIYRYARAYGTRMNIFLNDAETLEDMGRDFGDGIYEAEIIYLLKYEFAITVEDILWRRSKLGLHVRPETVKALKEALPGIIGGLREYDEALTTSH